MQFPSGPKGSDFDEGGVPTGDGMDLGDSFLFKIKELDDQSILRFELIEQLLDELVRGDGIAGQLIRVAGEDGVEDIGFGF